MTPFAGGEAQILCLGKWDLLGVFHIAAAGVGVVFGATVGGDPDQCLCVGIPSAAAAAGTVFVIMPGSLALGLTAVFTGFRYSAGGICPTVAGGFAIGDAASGADTGLGAAPGLPVVPQSLTLGLAAIRTDLRIGAAGTEPDVGMGGFRGCRFALLGRFRRKLRSGGWDADGDGIPAGIMRVLWRDRRTATQR